MSNFDITMGFRGGCDDLLERVSSRGKYEPRQHARNGDAVTSHDAAEKAAAFWKTQAGRILAALKARGPSTAHELAAHTELTVVQIDRRLPDLKADDKARVATQPNGADLVRGGARVWEAVLEH